MSLSRLDILPAGEAGYRWGFWDVDQACEKWLRKRGLINAERARLEFSGARLRGLRKMHAGRKEGK